MIRKLALAIPIFVFALFLPVIPGIGRFLKYGNFILAIGMVGLFWFLFSRRFRWLPAAALAVAMVLFAIPLAWLWQGDMADWGVIGGILPVSDASIYTMDAQRLGLGAFLSPISSHRPLPNGFLAILLWICGGSYPATLAVLAFLAAFAIFMLAEEVKRSQGPLAAAVTLVVLYLFYRTYTGKALTEILGLACAALAFTILLEGARQKMEWRVLFGLGMFTLAMNVRAGAYFAVFGLLLWAGYFFRRIWLVSRKTILTGLMVVAGVFGLNFIESGLIGTRDGMPFSNFADSFYGLAAGYKGWRLVGTVYPDATPAEKYQHTFELIAAQPKTLVKGMALAYLDFFNPGGYNLFSFLNFHVEEGGNLYTGSPGPDKAILYIPLFMLGGAGLVSCLRRRREGWAALILCGWAGLLLSVPFVPPRDAGMRPYAVTIPLVAFLLAEGVSWLARLARRGQPTPDPEVPAQAQDSQAVYASILLAALMLGGPVLLKVFARPPEPPAALQCAPGEQSLWIQPLPGARLDLVPDQPGAWIARPAIQVSDYVDSIRRLKLASTGLAATLAGVTPGHSLQFGVNLAQLNQDFRPIFLVVDSLQVSGGASPVQTCARLLAEESYGHFYQAR